MIKVMSNIKWNGSDGRLPPLRQYDGQDKKKLGEKGSFTLFGWLNRYSNQKTRHQNNTYPNIWSQSVKTERKKNLSTINVVCTFWKSTAGNCRRERKRERARTGQPITSPRLPHLVFLSISYLPHSTLLDKMSYSEDLHFNCKHGWHVQLDKQLPAL